MKQFNTTAVCIPSKHYMVDLSERVKEIMKLVDAGKYFAINRARQYGKTTTLSALRKALENTYDVASISFEKISSAGFATEESFVKAFSRLRSKSGLVLLSNYASKAELNEAGVEKIAEIINKTSKMGKSWSESKAQIILTGVNNNQEYISSPSHSAIIKSIAITVLAILDAITETDNALESLFEQNEQLMTDRALLMSIPGIGKQIAAALIGETGSFESFKNYRQLSAFYGLDQKVNQSGKGRRTGLGISKKGSSLARKMLRMAVQNSVYATKKGEPANPVLAEYFQAKANEKAPKVAETAVMRKLTAIIFAVMRDRKPFELRTPEEHISIMGIDTSKRISA